MNETKVAIQGIGGCNHYIAARKFFCKENIRTVDCSTFKELAEKVENDSSTLGIMAVENTIAGSILQNYRLIRNCGLRVIGEYKLRITHSLAALPGVSIGEIKEVNTHPMAFMQCAEFLESMPDAKLVEKDDTAGSAKWISDNGLRDHAAICPAVAAKLYGMNILADGIETNKRNFTRFLILAGKDVAKEKQDALIKAGETGEPDKSSIVFTLPHEKGSLSKVLTILSFYGMNLTMIQSLPIVGREWEYQFYINLMFEDYKRYRQAVDAIIPLTKELQVLGEYKEGETSASSSS